MGTYAKAFEIPEGFPAILREFAKEAIREQPTDIYRFGYDYFNNISSRIVTTRFAEDVPDIGSAVGNQSEEGLGIISLGVREVQTQEEDISPISDDAIDDRLVDRIAILFQKADSDGNGTLSRKEFIEVFELFGVEIGLTSRDILNILAEADSNDDGAIDYKEFLPVAAELIQAIMAKEQYAEVKEIRTKRASAKLDVQNFLMKGLPLIELEDSIQEIFRGADGDASGALDRQEFVRCLKESGLGFTRRELNIILTMIDKNGDGVIDYQEFMPVCFSMIVELLSDKAQEIPEEEMVLATRVQSLLMKATRNKDRLTSSAASECLINAGLGLRFVQVPAIMSTIEEGEDGLMSVDEVANAVAGVMSALEKLHAQQHTSKNDEIVTKFKESRQIQLLTSVAGFDENEFKGKVAGVFDAKCEGGERSLATKNAIGDAIKEVFPHLDSQQVHALALLAEEREDGRWSFDNIEKWGFKALQELQGQTVLLSSANVGDE